MPSPSRGRARLDLGEVDVALRELLEHAEQLPRSVLGECHRHGGEVVARTRVVALAEHHEPSDVVVIVLDAGGENLGSIELGGPAWGDRGGRHIRGHRLFNCFCSAERGSEFGVRQVLLQVSPALTQGLRMRIDALHRSQHHAGLHHQVVHDVKGQFLADVQPFLVQQHVQRVRNGALIAVLDRADRFVCLAEKDGHSRRGDRAVGDEFRVVCIVERCLFGEGALRPQIGDLHRRASPVSACHNSSSFSGGVMATMASSADSSGSLAAGLSSPFLWITAVSKVPCGSLMRDTG